MLYHQENYWQLEGWIFSPSLCPPQWSSWWALSVLMGKFCFLIAFVSCQAASTFILTWCLPFKSMYLHVHLDMYGKSDLLCLYCCRINDLSSGSGYNGALRFWERKILGHSSRLEGINHSFVNRKFLFRYVFK